MNNLQDLPHAVQPSGATDSQTCDCWNDHTDEGPSHTCSRVAAWRVSLLHTCDCSLDCQPHRDLFLLCGHCLAIWCDDPAGLDFHVFDLL